MTPEKQRALRDAVDGINQREFITLLTDVERIRMALGGYRNNRGLVGQIGRELLHVVDAAYEALAALDVDEDEYERRPESATPAEIEKACIEIAAAAGRHLIPVTAEAAKHWRRAQSLREHTAGHAETAALPLRLNAGGE